MHQNAISPCFVMRANFVFVLSPAKPSRPGRQIQARKTVLKQKSRSSTTKFWMYYNFSYVHVNFDNMFYTYEKRYVSKCNFSSLYFCNQNCAVVCYYGERSLVAFSRRTCQIQARKTVLK